MVIFREFKELNPLFVNKTTNIKFNYETESEEITDRNRKVLWILFDAFDYEIAFDDKEKSKEFMKNFKNLKKHSFSHSKMFTPGKDTMTALPYMLVGIKGFGNYVVDHTLFIKSDFENTKPVEFNFENTIFGRLKKINLTSSVFSSVLPYCIYLTHEPFAECKDYKLRNFIKRKSHFFLDGVFFTFPIVNKYKIFFTLLKNKEAEEQKKDTIEEIQIIKELKPKQKLEFIKDMDGHNIVFFKDIVASLEKKTNLTFVHTWYPHLGTKEEQMYVQKIFDFETSSEMLPLSAYTLNLKYTDLLLNKIMNILKKYQNQEILLILSSDHWSRKIRNTNDTNLYPVLFFAKILNDNTSIEASKETNAIHIQELIYKYLTKEISNHKEIEKFFNEKDGNQSYIIE